MSHPNSLGDGMVTLYGTTPSMAEVGLIGCRGMSPQALTELVDRARRSGILDGIVTAVDGEVDPNTYDTSSVSFRPAAPLKAAVQIGIDAAAEIGATQLDTFGAEWDGGRIGERTVGALPLQPAA